MEAADILVVDDDASIRDALLEYLSGHGYRVCAVPDAPSMDRALSATTVELVLLDVMMPGEDGLSVCRRLRSRGTPVLMLSALGSTTDRVVGLELGADDYLAKPFEPRELLARIRALLRRREVEMEPPEILRFGEWSFDLAARSLSRPDRKATVLTAGEARLLQAFAERPGRLLSRDQLIELARGDMAEAYDRSIDLAVSRLRRKLAEHATTSLIETVRGEGYRFLPRVRRG